MTAMTGDQTATKYLRTLTDAGLDDVLVLRRETAETVLTDKRIELLTEIATEDVESQRDLARRVDRDISIVNRDLDILFEAGVIDYDEEGRAKRPVLAHETVLVEPVIYEGTVVDDEITGADEAVAG